MQCRSPLDKIDEKFINNPDETFIVKFKVFKSKLEILKNKILENEQIIRHVFVWPDDSYVHVSAEVTGKNICNIFEENLVIDVSLVNKYNISD